MADTNNPENVSGVNPAAQPAASTAAKPAEPAAVKPAAPAAPKPAAAAPAPKSPARRQFFSWLALAWAAFAAATLGALSIVGRFLFPNVLFEPKDTFKIGFPEEYEIGVDNRWKAKYEIWVIRTSEIIYTLSTVCTHLGCTPSWFPSEDKFKCPCHGSGYDRHGMNIEGPAPRPLERFRISLAEDGQLFVDKSKKFQYEKGQWNDPDSFITA